MKGGPIPAFAALAALTAISLSAGKHARAAEPPAMVAASSAASTQGEADYALPPAPLGSAEFSADFLEYFQADSTFTPKGAPPRGRSCG